MRKIADELKKASNAAIFCHINCDGDAVGSSFALKQVLNNMGKRAEVFIDGFISDRLLFIPKTANMNYHTKFEDTGFDLFVCLDCGDIFRLGIYGEVFENAGRKICIDHHISNTGFADVNYIVPEASSTGEILFRLFEYMGAKITKETATMLYASISSDTGCFKYTNTSAETLRISASLIDSGADTATVNKRLFDTVTEKELKLQGYAINNLKFAFEKKVAYTGISLEALKKFGCVYEDAEGLSGLPRSVEGVEIGFVIKQKEDKLYKVSIRTNNYVDATQIACAFGGGGHKRAAGCSVEGSEEEAVEKILNVTQNILRGYEN